MRFGKILLLAALVIASSSLQSAVTEGVITDIPAGAMPVPATPVPLPRKGQIEYALQSGDDGMVLARTVHEWQHDGKHYVINGEMQAVGLIALFKRGKVVQRSEGMIEKGLVFKPLKFRLDRGNGKVESGVLDWQRMVATVQDGRAFPITPGIQDGLSIFYQLGRGAMPAEGLEMDMVSGRKVERYTFDWLGEETVSVPAGEYRAWHVRIRATSGDRDLREVWLGTAAKLPVKIRTVDRDGTVLVMKVEKIRFAQ